MRQSWALEPENLESPSDPRMGMSVSTVLDFFEFSRGKSNFYHLTILFSVLDDIYTIYSILVKPHRCTRDDLNSYKDMSFMPLVSIGMAIPW